MKKKILNTLAITAFLLIGNGLLAQAPPPPPADHGEGGNQPAGGSGSLTGGIGILMALGAAYGGRKLYKAFQSEDEKAE